MARYAFSIFLVITRIFIYKHINNISMQGENENIFVTLYSVAMCYHLSAT